MYQILASGIGVLIAVMIALNSQFAEALGNLSSSLIVHLAGLGLVSVILLFSPRKQIKIKIPFYLRLGGFVGVSLVLFNNICFQTLGASLTIALGVFGQTLGAQIVDLTGFLGMKKHKFRRKKLFGWFLVLAGMIVMIENAEGAWPYMILALVTGSLVMLSSVLNAQLAAKIGLYRGTRVNYTAGLITVFFLLLIFRTGTRPYKSLPEVPLYLILGGGILGVFITTGMNFVLPKIPTVYSSILIFLGQVSTGLVIDLLLTHTFSWQKALGAVIILLGLLVKSWVDKAAERKESL